VRIRHILLLLMLVGASAACSGEGDVGHGLSIAAPETHLGAHVFLDGERVGDLAHLDMHDSWLQSIMKRIYGDSPVFHIVALNIDLSNNALRPGEHQLRVEKPGQPAATGSFRYPFTGDRFQVFYVSGSRIEASEPSPANSP